MSKNGIAVAGSILVDVINTVSRYPLVGELTQVSDFSKSVGGCVPNVAIDLKKISPELDVFAVGKIGLDDNGSYVKESFADSGVISDMVLESDENATSFTQVISVLGGQRTFFTYPGASADFGVDDIDFDKLSVKILHLGYFLLLDKVDNGDGIKILQKAKEKGIATSIDLVSENSDRYKIVVPCLPYTDYLIINELEAGRITDMEPSLENIPKIAEKLMQLGVREKVIIHFVDGSICLSKGGKLTCLGSYNLEKDYIKGTTGAGDAFCAGSLYGIYNDFSDEEILKCGTVCATMALSTADATSGLIDIESAQVLCQKLNFRNLKL